MKALQVNELTKYYGKTKGIEGVSLEVDEGAFFGFIGPNGAGKSTTIRTLLGLIKASSGHAKILGLDFQKHQVEIMNQVGYLPSEVNLYGNLTAEAFLRYASSFYGSVDTKRIKALADWFEFDLSKRIDALSFGNKKKIGIIQALIHRPKLLIMDEPTSGLDPLMQARFFELLNKVNGEGTSIFFSSHTLSEVQRHCRDVAVIRDGHILEVERVEALRKKQLKHVRLSINRTSKIFEFEKALKIEGIYSVKRGEGGSISFDFDGEYKTLFNVLSKWQIERFSMEEPTLEEIFMHYYQGDPEDEVVEDE